MFAAKGKIYTFLLILLYYTFSGYLLDTFATGVIGSYSLVIADTVLIALGILSFGFEKNKVYSRILIALLVSSTITFFLNKVSIITHLNGLREYFIVISSFLFLNHIICSKYCLYFHVKFIWFCWLFLFMQVPISLHQFLQYGAGDAVGGGFGNGGSGVLTLSIFLVIFFLMVNRGIRNKESTFPLSRLLLFIPFLLPTFINETKLTFLLIIIFFLLLVKPRVGNIFKIIIIGALAFSLFSVYEFIYTTTTTKASFVQKEASYEKIFSSEFLTRYLSSEEVYDGKDVSRFTKIGFAFSIIYDNPMSLLFGKGMGLFKGGSVMEASQFSKKFDWLLSGTRPYLFFLLIQGGLIGALLTIFLLFFPLFSVKINSNSLILKRFRLLLILLLALILVYNPAFRTGGFTIIFSYLSLFIFHSERFVHFISPISESNTLPYTSNHHPRYVQSISTTRS